MLGNPGTTTLCNSHTNGNIVLIAAGGNDGGSKFKMHCDNGFA